MAAREPKRRRVDCKAIIVEWQNSHGIFKPLAESATGDAPIVTRWSSSQGRVVVIGGLANVPSAEAIHGLVRTAAARMTGPIATVRVRAQTHPSPGGLAFARGETPLHCAAINHFQALFMAELGQVAP